LSPRITPEVAARIEEFLVPSRIAVVATVGRGGMPHLTPNWYRYADGAITISTTKERVKYRNLIRDDKLAVCIYSDALASEYLTLTGRASVSDDESIWPETQAIVERYVEPEGVAASVRALRKQDRVLIRMEPERAIFRA
jgi:PPOX class probable F420-dependent enzyme